MDPPGAEAQPREAEERRRAAKALPFDEDGIGEGGALDAEAGGAVAARFTAAPKAGARSAREEWLGSWGEQEGVVLRES